MSDWIGVARRGLTAGEAHRRLAANGRNELPPPKRRSPARRLLDELVHFFAVMLWVAGALAVVAGMPELGVAIFMVIVVNACFSFAQQSRADRAAERLRALLPHRVTVRRDGQPCTVQAVDVVLGDVLLLESGDRIPADAVVLLAGGPLIDSALLTGESIPEVVAEGDTLFAGTFLVEGQAEAEVTATGPSTRLAAIARLTTATASPTNPLTLELRRVVRLVALIAIGVGASFFAVSMLLGNDVGEGSVFAIGVTVALVPEALLPTVTLSLAWGAEQMARRRVLVRNIDAVETLGSTTFICTDKTGTLTLNQMTVVQAWAPGVSAVVDEPGYVPVAAVVLSDPSRRQSMARLALAAARCSTGFLQRVGDGWQPHGDPMEVALDVFARRMAVDVDGDRATSTPTKRFSFDARRRRMSVVVGAEVFVKGAPDSVLPLCGDVGPAQSVVDTLTGTGLRVLAIAGRPTGATVPESAEDAECDLELFGLVALEDPPRTDARAAIEACRRAGIKLAMITGDHPLTATAIANEVGLRSPDGRVVTGTELPDDDQMLGALVDRDGIVIARVSPEDKVRIARALRARGHVVAMTGDGVNDGPALHESDIGIAMGQSGTDVAREAADLVLLDDHFGNIVAGIEQGRATFLNIRRFLTYHLTDNVAELTPFVVWALSGGRFPLALGVLQILALDIGTDTMSAVALGAESPAQDVLRRPPVAGRLLNRTVIRRAFGVLGPTEAVLAMGAFIVSLLGSGWRPGDPFPEGHALAMASGAAFMAVVLGQAANAFACRSSTHSAFALSWRSNRLLPPAVLVGLLVSVLTLAVGPIAQELGHARPSMVGWLAAAATPVGVLAVDTVAKKQHRRSR